VVEGAAAEVAELIDEPIPVKCSDAVAKASGTAFTKDDIVAPNLTCVWQNSCVAKLGANSRQFGNATPSDAVLTQNFEKKFFDRVPLARTPPETAGGDRVLRFTAQRLGVSARTVQYVVERKRHAEQSKTLTATL
jgi:hypothetical protein